MFGSEAVVLGIDPGLTRCGYAVLRVESHQKVSALAIGVIRTPAADALADRLLTIHVEVADLIQQFAPSAVAIEQVFFQNNVSTAMGVAHASGVVLALAKLNKCDVVQYTPSQVKSTVAGWGSASKEQVQKMVQQRLGLTSVPKPADAADAAAIALCHIAMAPFATATRAALSTGRRTA
jgi:crossover junction endodeoxyribonuclease RuvC